MKKPGGFFIGSLKLHTFFSWQNGGFLHPGGNGMVLRCQKWGKSLKMVGFPNWFPMFFFLPKVMISTWGVSFGGTTIEGTTQIATCDQKQPARFFHRAFRVSVRPRVAKLMVCNIWSNGFEKP